MPTHTHTFIFIRLAHPHFKVMQNVIYIHLCHLFRVNQPTRDLTLESLEVLTQKIHSPIIMRRKPLKLVLGFIRENPFYIHKFSKLQE